MTINTLDKLIAAMGAGSQNFIINKASIATQGAAGYSSLWRGTGTPAQGAIPGAAAQCDKTLTGALLNFTNPGVGSSAYIPILSLSCANAVSVIELHDRIAHMGGLSGVTATVQNVNVDASGAAAGRIPNLYSDLQWWLEIYTDIGTGAQTATVEYDSPNSGSPTATTTVAIGGSSPLNQDSRCFPIIGQAGIDGGQIKKIRRITHATTGTAGSYGITVTRRLATMSLVTAAMQKDFDWSALGLPVIPNDACLFFIEVCGTTSTGIVQGGGKIITG